MEKNRQASEKNDFWGTFTTNEWIYVGIIILAGILLRWVGLEIRAFHHDESLHAIYGKYIYDDPAHGYYKYSAMLHGPLLYNLLPYLYDIFGATKWAARSLGAFLGTCFLFMPLIFRKFLHKNTLLVMITLIAFSPTLIYWSRFIRHDFLVLSSMLLMLWGISIASERQKAFPIIIGLMLQFTIKENSYMTLAIITMYLVCEQLIKTFHGDSENTCLNKIIHYIKKNPLPVIMALIIGALIYVILYSAFFKYPRGILDGIYRKSLSYWIHQHNIERIKGPFIYQFLVLSWYEIVIVILMFVHAIHFYIKRCWHIRGIALATLLAAVSCHIIFSDGNISRIFIFNFLKLKLPLDFYPVFLIPVHAIIVTYFHIKDDKRILSFWGYFFFASLFSYSFAGEKVPWLAMYPLTTGIVYLSLYFQENLVFERLFETKIPKIKWSLGIVFLILIIIFNLKKSLTTNFARAGMKTELICQVHTDIKYENLVLKLKSELDSPLSGRRPTILSHNHTWPMSWFLLEYPEYSYHLGNRTYNEFDYVFSPKIQVNEEKKLLQTHNKLKMPFRSWWVPDYQNLNWKNFFKYLFTHNPWNSSGSSYVNIYIRKSLND